MTDRRSIADYKKGFMAVTSETDPLFVEAAADSRKGVQQLIAQTHKRLAKLADAKTLLRSVFFMKTKLGIKGAQ